MTASHLPLVNFTVAGAQKSGTQALGHFLAQHPDIGLPKDGLKEPHFFDQRIGKAVPGDYSTYHALYDQDALGRVTGDITPMYIFHPTALQKMQVYNPEMKVIVLLRDPVARAYSQWAMQVEMGVETRSFTKAVFAEPRDYRRFGVHPHFSYTQRGFYDRQIARLFSLFPPEQCLILQNSALRQDHGATLNKIYRFLGVSAQPAPERQIVHSRDYAPIPRGTALAMRALFHRDIRRLERRLNWDCRDWRLF